MENEEREQIPWSTLVAEVDRRPDKRWILAGVALAALLVAIVVIRTLGASAQPSPPADATVMPVSATTSSEPVATPTMVVAEDELIDTAGAAPPSDTAIVAARAEWFVVDFYTTDGSPETARSVRAALSPELDDIDLPHTAAVDVSFVEWARTVRVADDTDGSARVTVLFRTITGDAGGFTRLPVRAVSVTIGGASQGHRILGFPTEVDLSEVLGAARP